MATPGATIAERIEDLIGDEYATIPSLSYKDLINSAFNEFADMVSEDLLLKYSSTPTSVTSASGVSVEGKKLLKIVRVDANSSGIERECTPVDRAAYAQAKDNNSIYFATVYSPVYRLESNNAATTVEITPSCNDDGQIGRIWTFAYATNSTDLTAITEATLNTTHFLPNNAIHGIVLKSCINILQAYISNFIQDEEDQEMLQMIQAQLQGFQSAYQQEMSRFGVVEAGRPGSE
tara:strand:+ start:20 stop:721 length:702 start_codon:yes stop_codon:yes gene_type:complete